MKSKNKKSVFNINDLLVDVKNGILDDIEFITAGCNQKTGHVLSKNIELDTLCAQKTDMIELIRSGYDLPLVDVPQKTSESPSCKADTEDKNSEKNKSFRMPELILDNYNLPKINSKDFLQ